MHVTRYVPRKRAADLVPLVPCVCSHKTGLPGQPCNPWTGLPWEQHAPHRGCTFGKWHDLNCLSFLVSSASTSQTTHIVHVPALNSWSCKRISEGAETGQGKGYRLKKASNQNS
eukprot:1161671-Pelagomonas_calceolata.AAC.38